MRISPQLLAQVVAHARQEAPNECCGMIACNPWSPGEQLVAVQVRCARNVFQSPKRFQIDGREAARAYLDFDAAGWEIGGIYHSHTHTEPYPSQTDVNFAADWPGVEWLIVGLADSEPEVRSYLIDEGGIREVALEVR